MATSVTCLCGGVAASVQLDPSVDHTQLQLCHCNNCRAMSGLLCTSYYLMEHTPPSLDRLQEYRESPNLSRFFCPICGAHIFAQSAGQFLVASGVLSAEDTPSVQSIHHWGVGTTGDGGLSAIVLGQITDPVCRLKAFNRKTATDISDIPSSQSVNALQIQDGLRARCHCGGIEFYLSRPDKSSHQASSPWPDLLVPYHSGSSENPDNIKWWLRAKNTKYLAGTCMCPSCRLGSGFPIQTWAFVPKSNIFYPDGSRFEFGQGTMRQYISSPGVYRDFCARCGATAFWHCDERPILIDISVGLFHENGARAEDWLEWTLERVSFSEMAIQDDLAHRLQSTVCI